VPCARPRATRAFLTQTSSAYHSTVGVNLASIKGLAPLLVAKDLVSGIEFGEAFGGSRIVFVGVRMQLLGKAPETLLDILLGR
jgi:hypothetical protein